MEPRLFLKNLKNRQIKAIALIAFLSLYFILSCSIALKKSNTFDEPGHILAGYAYLREGMDFLATLDHPIMGRVPMAFFPAILLDLDFNPAVRPLMSDDSDFYPYSLKFLFENKVDGQRILFLSRLGNIMLGVVLGVYVFLWGERLWGVKGAVFSLFAYSLYPDMLAHSGISTTDFPLATFFFIAAYYLWRTLNEGLKPRLVVLAGVFTGLGLATKHTALLLLVFSVPVFIYSFRREKKSDFFLKAVIFAAFIYLTIWAVYGFRYSSEGVFYKGLFWDRISGPWVAGVFDVLRSLKALPEAYLYSFASAIGSAGAGRASFLMGEYSLEGWWYYFVVTFLIKTPVPIILFMIAAIAYSLRERALFFKTAALFAPALAIFIFVSMQTVNIGHRYLLSAYPFVFALIGIIPCIKTKSLKAARIVIAGFSLWFVYGAFSIHPHELAYFNEFIGGPANGYKYLVDSNIDWGQDLTGLKEYMDKNSIKTVKLAYFGFSDPSYYGIDYEYLPSYAINEPKNAKPRIELKGWFAISATMLQGVYMIDRDFYRVFRESEPVEKIGYSIFIYRL